MSVLPLQLLELEVVHTATGDVKLSWATANEENVSHFEIESGLDALTWEVVGKIAADQSETAVHNYSFTDKSVQRRSGALKAYYRLKMVDLDGSHAYSHIESVELDHHGTSIHVYPNPASSNLQISWSGNPTTLALHDITGRLLLSRDVQDQQHFELPLETISIPAGVYLVNLYDHKTLLARDRIVLLGTQ